MAKAQETKPRRKRANNAVTVRSRRSTPKKAVKKSLDKKPTEKTKIPSSFKLTASALLLIKRNWRVLGGILLAYILVNIFFASGLGNFSSTISKVEANIGVEEFGGNSLSRGIVGFASLFGVGGATGPASAAQSVLVVVVSLVIIWTLRQLLAGKKVGVKQAYYHSMGPFIPFVLIIFIIIIQLLPLTLGTAALGIVLSSVFTNVAVITIASSILFMVLAAWSLYMLCSSVLALYIVTLPYMEPRQAMRSAKNLVRFRRWQLMRRLVYLPVFIVLTMALIVIPLIILLPALAVASFYILGVLAILFTQTYLYSLYRSFL